MIYASLAWEFAADTYLMDLQSLILRTATDYPSRVLSRQLQVVFQIRVCKILSQIVK
jgi:hypothetical protein